MASNAALKDLDITNEELDGLQKALKDETFRKMFVEYAEEISNPENRKRYEEEIAELERNRGMDVKFLNPEPGFVFKTCVNGDKKAFINCCKNDNIGKPESKLTEQNGHTGYQWSIPHSLSPSREDLDKEGNKCQIFDCVFHPECFSAAEEDPRFKRMIEDTALDGIEREFKVKLDRKNLKQLKNMKYKGRMATTVIRTPNAQGPNTKKDGVSALNLPYPYESDSKDVNSNKTLTNGNVGSPLEKGTSQNGGIETWSTNGTRSDSHTVPNYTITHRGALDLQQFVNAPDSRPSTRPQELVVRINLPLVKSARGIQLDVFEKRLLLESNSPAAYRLDISLPFPVDENDGSAKFDKSKSCMVVTLPVQPAVVPALPSFAPPINDNSLIEEMSDGVEDICPSSTDDAISTESECGVMTQRGSKNVIRGNEMIENSTNYSSSGLDEKQNLNLTKLPQDDNKVTEQKLKGKDLDLQNENFILPAFSFHQSDKSISIVVEVSSVSSSTVETQLSQDGRDCWIHFQATTDNKENSPTLYGLQLVFPEGSKMASVTYNVSSSNLVFVLHKEDGHLQELKSFQAGPSKGNLQMKKFASQDSVQDSIRGLTSANQRQETESNNIDLKTVKVIPSEDGASTLDVELEVTVNKEEEEKTAKDSLLDHPKVVESELSIDVSAPKVVESELSIDVSSSISEATSSPSPSDLTPLSPHSLLKSSLRNRRKRSSKSVSFSDEVVVGTFVDLQGRKGRKKSPYIRRSKQKLKAPSQEVCSDSELVLSYRGGGDDSEEDLWNIVPPRRRTIHRQSSSESESDGLNSPKGKHRKSKGSRRRRKEKARKALMMEGSPEDTKTDEDLVFTDRPSNNETLAVASLSEDPEISSGGNGNKSPMSDESKEEEEEETNPAEDGEWTTVTKKRHQKTDENNGEDKKERDDSLEKDVVDLDMLDHHTQSAVEFSNSVMFDLDD